MRPIEPCAIPGVTLSIDETAVHVASQEPLTVLSSAVVGGELRVARHIVNLHVRKDYDDPHPENDLAAGAARLGITEPFVGMMTAARTQNARVAVETHAGVTVVAVVTAGLSNLTAAGVSPTSTNRFKDVGDVSPPAEWRPGTTRGRLGTINTILLIDAALTPAAMINAVITATEAKTLVLVEAGVRTPHGGLASGTSTDSIVLATTERGARFEYAGPISPVGALIGRAVRRALQETLQK